MADTPRSLSNILALLADNNSGDITPQDLRDAIVSIFNVYGSIYVQNGSTTTSGITTAPEQVRGFIANGPASEMTVDASADTITVSVDGIYRIMWSGSWTGTANTTYKFRIRKNGAEQHIGITKQSDAANDQTAATMAGHLSLVAGDAISVWVQSDVGGGADLTPVDMQLVMEKVG